MPDVEDDPMLAELRKISGQLAAQSQTARADMERTVNQALGDALDKIVAKFTSQRAEIMERMDKAARWALLGWGILAGVGIATLFVAIRDLLT